jgi:serine/threonine protein kinase
VKARTAFGEGQKLDAGSGPKPDFSPQGQVGPYLLSSVLGEGGMGRVYRAEHVRSRTRVALKTVNRTTRQRMLALREEVVALRAVAHPGLVKILDEGSHEGVPWYTMELLTGKTLAHYNDSLWDSGLDVTRSGVSRTSTLAPYPRSSESAEPISGVVLNPRVAVAGGALQAALRLYQRLCEPLAHIHARGMVHRDLKPHNVFIRTDDTPVLMDFGLIGYASGAIGREILDAGNQGFGTVHYVAPERIEGRHVDARADLYSLGCMLYETLLGRPPFIGDPGHVLSQHMSAQPLAPSDILSGVPPRLEELILSLLAKVPQERMGHASDVAALLADALGESHVASRVSQAVPLFRPKLSGRDGILKTLAGGLQRALVGNGGMLLVGGESGIGKTFLTSELAYSALKQGFRVVTGGGTPLAAQTNDQRVPSAGPFHPVRRLLQTIADACLELGPEERLRVLGERAVYLAPYEPSLKPFVTQASFNADTLPGAAGSERVVSAFAATLRAHVNHSPLLLIIDDLQWADKLTLSLLESLDAAFFEGLPLLVIGAYRTDQVSLALEALRASPVCRTLSLGRLAERDVRHMVTDMLSSEPPDHLVSFLMTESEGNPFFVAEYLRYLVSANQLERQQGCWAMAGERTGQPTDYGSIRTPGKLAELLAWRLDALSPESQNILHAAAVLGRSFDLDVLARMLRVSEEELLPRLVRAQERQVVESVALNRYRFVHDKIREASYAALSAHASSRLHSDAARAIEASPPDGEGALSRAVELARHYKLAGELLQATKYFGLAGEEALKKSAVHEAIDHLRAALQLAGASAEVSVDQQARWERLLGGALHDIGEFEAGNVHLGRALTLLGEQPLPQRTLALARLALLQVGKQAVRRLRTEHPDPSTDSRRLLECARIYDRLQQAAYYTGQVLPMLYTCLRTLNLAEQAEASPTLTIAYSNAYAVAGVMPIPKLVGIYERLAQGSMQAAPNVVAEAYFRMLSGVYSSGIGAWEEALVSLNEGLDLSRRVSFAQRAREIIGAMSIVQFLKGDYPSARLFAEQVQAQSTPRYAHTFCWGMLSRAQVLLVQGELSSALSDIDVCKGAPKGLGRPEHIWSASLQAYLHAKLGDWAAAERFSRQALDEIAKAPTVTHFTLDAVARCAEVRVWLSRLHPGAASAQDRQSVRKALDGLRAVRGAFPVAEPRARLIQGYWQRTQGQPAKARRSFELSLSAATRLDMRYDRARALLALGASGSEARAEAAGLLRTLGADPGVAELL